MDDVVEPGDLIMYFDGAPALYCGSTYEDLGTAGVHGALKVEGWRHYFIVNGVIKSTGLIAARLRSSTWRVLSRFRDAHG